MRSIVFILMCTVGTVEAAEIPARFRGVWASLAAGDVSCKAVDWKGVGRTEDDRLVQVTSRSILSFESGCDVRSSATAAISAGVNKMTDGPTTFTFVCSGEGMSETVRETWDLTNVGGKDVLISSQIGKPRILTYARCR